MPRWPAGLHQAAGSLPAAGQRPRRADPVPQRHYWRHVTTELHASGSVNPRFIVFDQLFSMTASVGPTAAGERWAVDMVQVNTDGQTGSPPLVAEQIQAQIAGSTINPPPPVTAQVWLSVAGQFIHLLAQTSQGGYDNIGLGGQTVQAGEQISVQWWVSEQITSANITSAGWFTLRGTRYTLSQY